MAPPLLDHPLGAAACEVECSWLGRCVVVIVLLERALTPCSVSGSLSRQRRSLFDCLCGSMRTDATVFAAECIADKFGGLRPLWPFSSCPCFTR